MRSLRETLFELRPFGSAIPDKRSYYSSGDGKGQGVHGNVIIGGGVTSRGNGAMRDGCYANCFRGLNFIFYGAVRDGGGLDGFIGHL